MNKATKLLKQSKEEMESKKIPTLINKGKLALENYANDIQLKIIDIENQLEEATLQFVKGDTKIIPLLLELQDNLELLKNDLGNLHILQDELYKD